MSQPGSSAVAGGSPRVGRVPDFFLVGHAKCGTTALYEMLRAHPQIFMPDVKEPQFFARNQGPQGPGKTFEQTGRRAMTLEQYLALFADARPDQLLGEASTFYIWSPVAAERIAHMQPRAKIVAILREPASFLHSLHMQMLQNGSETERDLLRALDLEPERRTGRGIPARAHWPAALIYSDRVRYTEQLRRFHAVFPPEQVLVLIYEDYRQRNEETVRRVLRFLEVDPSIGLPEISANPSVELRSVRLREGLKDVRTGRGRGPRMLGETIRLLTPRPLRHKLLKTVRQRVMFREPNPPDAALMAALRQRFAPEVHAISEYLGRDLSALWGYERP